MDKLASLVIFAAFFTLACSFPSENRDFEEEWMNEAREVAADEEKLVTRSKIPCGEELGLLKHYGVNLKGSHIDCNQATNKRAENLIAREFKKRELEYELTRFARKDFSACCSPDCDWLLDYLEIDSSVVKCLDRK